MLSRNAGVNYRPHVVVATTVTSAGSTLATATDLTADLNVLSTVTTGQGVSLNDMEIGDSQEVYNNTVTECLVYPPTTSYAINQIAAGSAHVLPGYTSCVYRKVSTARIVAYQSS